MKNISLNIMPYGGYPPAPPPMPLQQPGKPITQNCSVSFSAQFDDEKMALDFASFIIAQINSFKDINNA